MKPLVIIGVQPADRGNSRNLDEHGTDVYLADYEKVRITIDRACINLSAESGPHSLCKAENLTVNKLIAHYHCFKSGKSITELV